MEGGKGNSIKFLVAAEGSSTAFVGLKDGSTDIGMTSRNVKTEEREELEKDENKLIEHVVAYDMIGIVINAQNPIKNLTLKQVEQIFTQDVTSWDEVGGGEMPISVYTRNTSSGTYKSFQRMAMNGRPYGKTTQKLAGGESPASEVANNEQGITYVGLVYTNKDGIKALSIDGISLKPKNAAKYPISRPLYFYTVSQPKGIVSDFIQWVKTSPDAREVIEGVGFIPVPRKNEPTGSVR